MTADLIRNARIAELKNLIAVAVKYGALKTAANLRAELERLTK